MWSVKSRVEYRQRSVESGMCCVERGVGGLRSVKCRV